MSEFGCNRLFIKTLRFWNKARTKNQVLKNIFNKLNGNYYRYLIYNLNLESEGDKVYNIVRQLESVDNNSNNISESSLNYDNLSFDNYYSFDINPNTYKFAPTWGIFTDNNEDDILDSNHYKRCRFFSA